MNQHIQERILKLEELRKQIPMSKTAIYKAVANGSFPKPLSLGARSVGWKQSEVFQWVSDLKVV